MHMVVRLHADLSQICRLCTHVWPYITSAFPLLLSSCCSPISLPAALLEVAKPPCESTSLLSLTFPFSFSCYIEHTSGISSFPLNLSISLHRNKKLVCGNKRFHSPTGMSRWIWLLEVWVWASGPLGVGEGGCQKDNIPENRWDYMAQPIKLPHKQVEKQPTSQDGLILTSQKNCYFSLNFDKPAFDADLFW